MLTVLLIPINLWGIFVFSFYGTFGVAISIFGTLDNLPFNEYPIIPGTIWLIIITPIVLLVWKNRQIWWQVMFKSLSFLLLYLIIGMGIICAFLFGVGFILESAQAFRVACQILSLFLAIGYFFYFKKVIKPYSLKP